VLGPVLFYVWWGGKGLVFSRGDKNRRRLGCKGRGGLLTGGGGGGGGGTYTEFKQKGAVCFFGKALGFGDCFFRAGSGGGPFQIFCKLGLAL